MPNPYTPHLLYGTVTNSKGFVVPRAQIDVITSVGHRIYNANADGIYMFDISDIGYTAGETITLRTTEQFNNELKDHKYLVTGSFSEENIALELRTAVENISNLQEQNVLHTVGKKPITTDNPLPISNVGFPLDGYMLSGGQQDGTFSGYVNKEGAWYIQKFDSSNETYVYSRGSGNFLISWNNRTELIYEFPNEVF